MEHRDISHLKGKVHCSAVLETAGFAVDLKQSTRRAIKFRRGDDIIIVIHDGKGWFDPLSEAKGNVLSLIQHLDSVAFTEALARAAELVGTTTLPRLNRAADDTSRAARQLGRTAGGVSDNPQLFIYGSGRIPPGPGEPGFAAP